jgi:hypothetical protein
MKTQYSDTQPGQEEIKMAKYEKGETVPTE